VRDAEHPQAATAALRTAGKADSARHGRSASCSAPVSQYA
jgi:hypothetical protein